MLLSGITEVEYDYEDIKVTGVVGNASIARSNRNGQIFFVNQRYVKDKTLTSSVEQAYRDILPAGKYAFVILNIEINPSQVDCNVHPAKLEVRFEDEQKVFKAIYHAIKSKNEEIAIRKQIEKPEIESQEEIEEPSKEEEEEFKPREGTFSGFFKMFKREEEEQEENTLIEELYEAKQREGFGWNPSEEKEEETKEQEEQKEETEEIKKEEEKIPEVKLGNTIISSDTRESAYDVEDLMNEMAKQETVKLDTTKLFSANDAKTEIMDSLKKIEDENHRETMILDTEEIRNETGTEEKAEETLSEKEIKLEELEKNTITERLLEQKVQSDMDDTQFIDTGKVRSELRSSQLEEDIPITKEFANMYKQVFGMDVSTVRKNKEEEDAKLDVSSDMQFVNTIENETVFQKEEELEEAPTIPYKYIGTIFEKYAIIEVKDEMYMIEKSAAEERLMYEVVKENFYDEENNDSVALLLADIVTLSSKEMSMAKDLLKTFQKSGFDYEEFGENTLKLTKVPSWAESLNTKKLFLEILREMDTVAVTATQEKEEKFIATVSNKFVELSDTSLSEKELEDLIRRLLKLPSPFMYPNGRLTAVKISRSNMEKKFSRR